MTPSSNAATRTTRYTNSLPERRRNLLSIPPARIPRPSLRTREKADLFVDTLEDSFQENITPYDDDHIDKVDRTVRRFLRNNIPIYPPLTSPQEICEIIKKLKNKKAPRQDQIRNIALKSLPINAITHLTKIINRCLMYNHFPKPWKHAILTMIPKPGKRPKVSLSIFDPSAHLIHRKNLRKNSPKKN
ncbi:uncharacterized protein TNCV_1484611 [Trichonephila clavipes]|nr:uncharacterized protein TNCV_1484611 [Trichonephila clavipes]